MRHLHLKGRLGLPTFHRNAVLRNLLSSLLKHERIQTTLARAKQLKRYAEPFIELGKRNDFSAKRWASRAIHEKESFLKLFEVYGPRFKNRQGGYTRIFQLQPRHGDGAQMSLIEILPEEGKEHEPRVVKMKRALTEEEKKKAADSKKTKKENKHLKKQEAQARAESKKAHKTKDVSHSHVSQGRKTEAGTGRSKGSKKGLS